jgi:hypothetical protein
VGTLGDAGERAHAEGQDLLRPERLGGDVLLSVRDLLRAAGKLLGRQLVGGGVREVAGAVRGSGHARRALRGGEGAVVSPDQHESLERARTIAVPLPAAGVVAAEHETVDGRARLLGRRNVEVGIEDPRHRSTDPRRRAGDPRGGGSHGVGVHRRARPEAGGDDPAV